MRASSGKVPPVEPVGIAATVGALVMRADPLADVGEARVLEDLRAELGVSLDDANSSSVSGPGLQRMLSGTPTLPMSWSIPASLTRSHLLLGRTELSGHHLGVASDRLGVPGAAAEAQVDGLGEVEYDRDEALPLMSRARLACAAHGSAGLWSTVRLRPLPWPHTAPRRRRGGALPLVSACSGVAGRCRS